eukprot:gene4258-4823_t
MAYMAAATNTHKSTTITITPSKPPGNKRFRENEPKVKSLENFVNNFNKDDGVQGQHVEGQQGSVKIRPRPNVSSTEGALFNEIKEIKDMFLSFSSRLLKLDKLDQIEFTIKETRHELRGARKEIEQVKFENSELKAKVAQLEAKLNDVDLGRISKLEERIIDIQSHSMRDNLVFYNVPEDDSKNPEEAIKEIISEKLA